MTNEIIDIIGNIVDSIFSKQQCYVESDLNKSALNLAKSMLKNRYQKKVSDDTTIIQVFHKDGYDSCELCTQLIKNGVFNNYPDIKQKFQGCDGLLIVVKSVFKEYGIHCQRQF